MRLGYRPAARSEEEEVNDEEEGEDEVEEGPSG